MIRRKRYFKESVDANDLFDKVMSVFEHTSSVVECDLQKENKAVFVDKTGNKFFVVELLHLRDASKVRVTELTIMGRSNFYDIKNEDNLSDWIDNTLL